MLSLVAKGPPHTGECRGPFRFSLAVAQWCAGSFLTHWMWSGLPEGVEETNIGAELRPAKSSSAAVSAC